MNDMCMQQEIFNRFPEKTILEFKIDQCDKQTALHMPSTIIDELVPMARPKNRDNQAMSRLP